MYRPVLMNVERYDVDAADVDPSEPDGVAADLPKIQTKKASNLALQ